MMRGGAIVFIWTNRVYISRTVDRVTLSILDYGRPGASKEDRPEMGVL
jgi:hypothetical protein